MNTPQTLFEKERQYFFPTYKRLPLDIVRGEGCYLYDRDGKRYLDFFGGLAVNALGYGHSKVLQAIREQAEKYIHLSNYFVQEPQVRLAEKLLSVTGYQRIFFTNSGTEAIEGAIKLARKWGKKLGKTDLYGMTNSFHGRTMGALSLTERLKYRQDYEPFLENVYHITFNSSVALREKVDERTLGVVLEFIQGEGGVNPVSREFVAELEALREQYGFLIIADAIQCGMGRTGKFFSFEHFNIRPDIVCIAKAIGGGIPLGAFLGNERTVEVFSYGVHGTTFGGNPLACAAGLAVLNEVVDGGLMKRAGEIGHYLINGFRTLQAEMPTLITDVRGMGCMLGVELSFDGQPVVDELLNRGILVNCTNTTVLRFLPPYVVTNEQCDTLLEELRNVLRLHLPAS
jgi:acetylornithine/N-succinyldiaminopimelate aminotransferase